MALKDIHSCYELVQNIASLSLKYKLLLPSHEIYICIHNTKALDRDRLWVMSFVLD